ncbi:MAG: pyridoxal-phosphate dependent enzyme [Armatimonadota bacterium]|nr:pyridoxal-phosphate dependent enzyme [Armatimonadota bacterium]MDR7452466.1 pyridoxal-phosphate dependent enzyme [Armatimonadota bacterium]MDR7494089.1 pyridoxal-phosphate dependent enzyme [Armatimonadota bacterium]MDR7498944.1 pyridoxal-phosphate dependent enzyme [Armatimonadota bacterium]MDR7504345.1 pyridoxal-phosphate dependent enzyme [Armatimonadota bacterium]
MSSLVGLRCLRCGADYPPAEMFAGCPRCLRDGRPANVTSVYRYDGMPVGREMFRGRRRSMWRYRELLPVAGEPVTLEEGGTPLVALPRLGARWGVPDLYIKDESRNPTGSFKDRMASVIVTRAKEAGYRTVAIASSGNAGAALAAYAARAGLTCVVLTTAGAPAALVAQMQALGARLLATRTAEDRWTLLRLGVEQLGWYAAGNYLQPPVGSNPYGVDGYKTIAFEILEALDWKVPSAVALPVCYGDGLWGVTKGFAEARQLGLVERAPDLLAGEVFGPLAHALTHHLDEVRPVPAGRSVAVSIAAGISTYQALHALRTGGGAAVVVDDEELLAVQGELGAQEGLFAEVSAVAALAALRRRAQDGDRPAGPVVAVVTATGLKDPGAAPPRSRLPVIEPTLDALRQTLREAYGMTV